MSDFLRRVFLLSALFPGVLEAQFFQQGNKLVGSGGPADTNLGAALAVSADGNTAIVGGPGDNGGVGAVWIFTRTGGVWSQQGPKLIGSGAVGNASQGFSVAISADGNTAIVGGLGDNTGVGAAWIFTRTNGAWAQQGPKLVGSGAVGIAVQGTSVAISGDGNTVMLGSPYDGYVPGAGESGSGTQTPLAGAVWVFTRTGGVWTQQGSKLVGSGVAVGSNQGQSVSLSGDGNTAIVGGPGDNIAVGAAWIFTRSGDVWTQQGPKLVGSGAVGNSQQGVSIAISADGNTAAVGGLTDSAATGGVWIFTRANGVWTQQGPKLADNNAVGQVGQGSSVGISGDGNTALIGGPGDSQGLGAAWVYTRADGVWGWQGSKLTGAGAARPSSQGHAVAISGDGHTALVGGPTDFPLGSVWVFVSSPVRLAVSTPSTVIAGSPFSFLVTAVDTNNLPVTSYTGTVHFSTNDPIGSLPADALLTNGTGTFTATLKTGSANPAITAADIVNQYISGTSVPIGIQAAGVANLALSAIPPTAIPGVPFNFTVLAYDSFGNPVVLSPDRLHFSSSDGSAILPADSSLPAGGTFSAILKTAGTQTITAIDTARPSATATSTPITVGGSIANSFNLALHSLASQSSTFFGAAASLAVDGNTDGNYYDGSVTATTFENGAWWETDLGASAAISTIVIWNRTDCCNSATVSGYWVFVSDTPFGASDTADMLQHRAGTFASLQGGPAASISIAVGAHGRYVRVQLAGLAPGFLSLAEVQVFGTPGSTATSGIAQGHPATQSSTYPGPGAAAASAVDGNTDGSFFDGSVTATNADPNAWWQVDLGATAAVRSVVIWNRADCCAGRLSDYWVFVSDIPFLPADTPATLQNRAATYSSHQTAAPSPAAPIGFGGTTGVNGRYLRVQLSGTDYLSLAEVQVFGAAGVLPPNVALGKAASQSSTYPGFATDGASSAVDDNTDGNFYDGSVTATDFEPNPWWQVDLGASTAVSSIAIWNRTDCCDTRLSNYWVFVSDTPFLASDTPATLQTRAGTFASHQSVESFPTATISTPGVHGRYVRVQLSGTDYLSLAEVQVFGQ